MSDPRRVVGDLSVDTNNLYREESYTDLKVASLRPTVLRPTTAAPTFWLSSAELLATMAFLVVFRLLSRDFFWIVIVLAPRKPAFYFRCGFDAFLFSKGHAKLEQTITKPYPPLESIGCRKAICSGTEASRVNLVKG